jgi:hypothetical protein
MSSNDLLVSQFAVPCGQSQVQTPDLSARILQRSDLTPIRNPFATSAGYVHPNPSLLTFATVVHPTHLDVLEADGSGAFEAKNGPVLVDEAKALTKQTPLTVHGF